MEFFSWGFLSALLIIIFIDLVLAGDNAIVIALAARNLKKEQQKKVILMGTAGAIIIRSTATLIVVWLLEIPWLLLCGGILLIWIAYKLVTEEKNHNIKAGNSIISAIITIIVADATMGLDNVLAVAGAAEGNYVLVILGLLISIPIIVWGSTIILKWIERFPSIIYIGAGILTFTAAKMITGEPHFATYFHDHPFIKWSLIIVIIIIVMGLGKWTNYMRMKSAKNELNSVNITHS